MDLKKTDKIDKENMENIMQTTKIILDNGLATNIVNNNQLDFKGQVGSVKYETKSTTSGSHTNQYTLRDKEDQTKYIFKMFCCHQQWKQKLSKMLLTIYV